MPRFLSEPTKILLTGGTSGIGRQMLEILLSQGHELIVVSRTARDLPKQQSLATIDADLAHPGEVKLLAAQIAADHPDIRILINNAALQYPVAMTDPLFDVARMEEEVAINLIAPTILIHALLPSMRRLGSGTAIVNISSGLAFFPKRQTALYCATKAAIHSLSQSLRYQLEAEDVAVMEAILPIVDTPMTEGRGSGKITARRAADAIIRGIMEGQAENYIGKAKLIPILSRLAPAVGKAIMQRA